MIRVTDLTVRRGSFVLENISIEVPGGHSFVLLGPSGAGKTQLIETIMGLNRPESGQVVIADQDVTALAPEQRRIGYLPQDLGLFPHLSVIDNIMFGPRVQKLDQARSRDRLERLVALLGLQAFLGRKSIGQLSGGEKQRVALARALVVEPRVLFLDEPFASLDQMLRRELQLQFRALQQTLGVTFFFVTHDLDDAALLADGLGVLIGGRLVQCGTVEQVFGRPATEETARFLMWRNLLPGRVEQVLEGGKEAAVGIGSGLSIRCSAWGGDVLCLGQEVCVGLNPSAMRLRPVGDGSRVAGSAEDQIVMTGVVTRVLEMASHSVAFVELAHGVEIEVDARREGIAGRGSNRGGSGLTAGASVEVTFQRSAVAVFA